MCECDKYITATSAPLACRLKICESRRICSMCQSSYIHRAQLVPKRQAPLQKCASPDRLTQNQCRGVTFSCKLTPKQTKSRLIADQMSYADLSEASLQLHLPISHDTYRTHRGLSLSRSNSAKAHRGGIYIYKRADRCSRRFVNLKPNQSLISLISRQCLDSLV